MEMNISERQRSWPLPSVLMQAGLCVLTFGSAYVFGRIGVAAALLLVVLLPTRRLLALLQQGDYSGVAAVYLGTMLVANIDGLATLLSDQQEEGTRGSWPVVLATIAVAFYRLPKLRGEYIPALLLFINLFLMRVLSAGDEMVQAALRQTSYLFALILFLTVLVSKTNREALVEKLVLVAAACAGHYSCEMLSPTSDLSISSTQIEGVVGRAAGLYANANNAGIILAYIALLTCFSCTNAPLDRLDKLRLLSLHFFCLIGIGMTFSRNAVLILAMPLLIVTSKVSGAQRGKLVVAIPFAFASGLALLFLGFELLSHTNQGLSQDALARYASLKRVISFGLLSTDSERAEIQQDRLDNLRDTARYWSDPSLLGMGQEQLKKEFQSGQIPHNQLIMLLMEDGYLGGLLFLLACAACVGTRWSTTTKNTLNAVIAMLAFIALAIGTYNMFDYRFLALPVTMLMWICLTPPVADSRPLRPPITPRDEIRSLSGAAK